jgi:putative transposase
MPRAKLILSDEFPYHVQNRSNNREFFYLPIATLWPIFLECLEGLTQMYGCRIHSFVLMSNHYHLMISTPRANLGEAMKYFHREVARKANRISGRINHFFGGRYKWSIVGTESYYWNALKYVFRNPVRAGICTEVSDYEFSSLNRPSDFTWLLSDFFLNPSVHIEIDLDWLNEPFLSEIEEAIQKGLRRRKFSISKKPDGSQIHLPAVRPRKGTVTSD